MVKAAQMLHGDIVITHSHINFQMPTYIFKSQILAYVGFFLVLTFYNLSFVYMQQGVMGADEVIYLLAMVLLFLIGFY